MGKTFASVTDLACRCGYLEDAALDPDSPIVFDKTTGEFSFAYTPKTGQGKGSLTIYHCPFCGGTTPESVRGKQFAVISETEHQRLKELTKGVKTIDDALAILGLPDEDIPDGVTKKTRESGDQPPSLQPYRILKYNNLSDVAIVNLMNFHKDQVYFIYTGKYIGPPADKPCE